MEENKYDYRLNDFLSGAYNSFLNGTCHYELAELAAEHINYGFAISHLIMAGEELIKSLILILLSNDINCLDDEEKDILFKNHSCGHINVKELLKSIRDDGADILFENIFDQATSTGKYHECREALHFLHYTLDLHILYDSDVKKFSDLIKDSDGLKNRGLYSDIKQNQQSPEDFSKKKYTAYSDLISRLVICIEPAFEMPLTDEIIMTFAYGE